MKEAETKTDPLMDQSVSLCQAHSCGNEDSSISVIRPHVHMRWARLPTTEQSMRVTQLKPNTDVCRKLNNNNLPTETQIFVLFTVFTLLFIRQKEERLQKEDLEGRGRENDYGCSPTTTAATRRTGRWTPAGSAATPEDEVDAQLTTTRVGLSVGWRQFWNQRPNLFFFNYYYYYYYASHQPVQPEPAVQQNHVYWKHKINN